MKRKLAVAVALVAVLAGGTAVALGATGGSRHGHGHHRAHAAQARRGTSFLTVAAGYLGLTATELQQQLSSGKSLGEIAAASPGHSEAGLIAALVAAKQARLAQIAARAGSQVATLVHRHGLRSESSSRRTALRSAAASYLGLSHAQITAALRGGKSLAQLAGKTPGKSSAGLIDAIVAAASTDASEAPPAKADESQRHAKLRERVTALVNRKRGLARQG